MPRFTICGKPLFPVHLAPVPDSIAAAHSTAAAVDFRGVCEFGDVPTFCLGHNDHLTEHVLTNDSGEVVYACM